MQLIHSLALLALSLSLTTLAAPAVVPDLETAALEKRWLVVHTKHSDSGHQRSKVSAGTGLVFDKNGKLLKPYTDPEGDRKLRNANGMLRAGI